MNDTTTPEAIQGGDGYIDLPPVHLSPIEALKVSAEGFSMPDKDPPSPMSEAIRKEIIRIATTGDPKNHGMFTVNVAAHIERLVVAGRDILLAEKIATNDLDALLKSRRRRNGAGIYNNTIMGGVNLDSDDYDGPLAVTNPTENFGMSAIRQVVDGLKAQSETPEKLVAALAAAKEAGLTNVVAALEARLGVTPTEAKPALAPVAPTEGTP